MSISSSSKLQFSFSINDPEFISENIVVNDSTTNYISHAFVRCPIYKCSNTLIGYKVSDDYVQQVGTNKYIVRLNNTYSINDSNGIPTGTISWQYVFVNTLPEIYYPVNVVASSTILSGTGIYKGKTGTVKLLPKENGTRCVTIKFTN